MLAFERYIVFGVPFTSTLVLYDCLKEERLEFAFDHGITFDYDLLYFPGEPSYRLLVLQNLNVLIVGQSQKSEHKSRVNWLYDWRTDSVIEWPELISNAVPDSLTLVDNRRVFAMGGDLQRHAVEILDIRDASSGWLSAELLPN
jgi:hypothetical protein